MAEEAGSETISEPGVMGYVQAHSDEIINQVSEYGYLIGDSLGFILVGMLVVFILHKLANRFLYSYVKNGRFMMVTFGALYALVLVVTIILVFKKIGFDVSTIGPVAILVVLFLAVLLYFIIPFLPRLPFIPGHMVETHGVMGMVDAVSTFHTTIRKFDGTMAFVPNAMLMATKILNYSDTPNRRIEMKLLVTTDSDLDVAKAIIQEVAAIEHRVLPDPAPAVFIMQADAVSVEIMLYCWVANADFLGARSDLWQELLKAVQEEGRLALSLPQQEIHLRNEV